MRQQQNPSPVEEGWGEESKINSPHPDLLPQEERSTHLCK